MASISKIVTALVILQAKPLSSATTPGPTITFSKDDHALYDIGAQHRSQAGERQCRQDAVAENRELRDRASRWVSREAVRGSSGPETRQ